MTENPVTIRQWTHALLYPDTLEAALQCMPEEEHPAIIEALVEVVDEAPTARSAKLALNALLPFEHPLVDSIIRESLESPHAMVRIKAVEAVNQSQVQDCESQLSQMLRRDESWLARRGALRALANSASHREDIFQAADDPHWRVRHALIQVLIECEDRQWIDNQLSQHNDPRAKGVRDYLIWKWTGNCPDQSSIDLANPEAICPIWDWDPAVLARNIGELETCHTWMPFLMSHTDERVRRRAMHHLRKSGTAQQWIEVLQWLDDPRLGVSSTVHQLLSYLNLDQIEEIAYAMPQDDLANQNQEDNPQRIDTDPRVRRDSLTIERAQELMENPELETSWRVLQEAAKMCRKPFWNVEPKPRWRPSQPQPEVLPIHLPKIEPLTPRLFGPEQWPVTPLGISGHYGLPVEGFVHAIERGVNLLFWEPNYSTLTDFASRITAKDRAELYFVAGTFEAEGEAIRRDVERALRRLQLERLDLFLLFWTRSWDRINEEVLYTLESLKEAGLIDVYSLSTHSRPLAVEAIERGWNPVMVRHSAAHRKAEELIFPKAIEMETSIITFNTTCYGRLMKLPPGDPPSAADCIRYTLNQPGVTACFSAPATMEQLEENLTALTEPDLPEARREALRAQGDVVYEEDSTFRKLVRSR